MTSDQRKVVLAMLEGVQAMADMGHAMSAVDVMQRIDGIMGREPMMNMPRMPHPREIADWLLAMARSGGSRHIDLICRDAAMADAWEALLALAVVPMELTVHIRVGHGDMSLHDALDLRTLPAYAYRIVRVGTREEPSSDETNSQSQQGNRDDDT